MKKYIEERLVSSPPVPCDFKVGDKVVYTNEFGVIFKDMEIIGFSKSDHDLFKYGKFIHLNSDCYWMPESPDSLQIQVEGMEVISPTRDLTLNNGQIAKYTHTDFWCRPIYTLESGVTVCCIELNGTSLTTVTDDGEPCLLLRHEYQPAQ